MGEKSKSRRARRKAREQVGNAAQSAQRTWALFGEAMRFAHAHAAPNTDVFSLMRFGGDKDGSLLDHFCTLHPGLSAVDKTKVRFFAHAFSSLFHVEQGDHSPMVLTDLVTGRRHEVLVMQAQLAEGATPGALVATILIPWEGGWLLGGTARPVRADVGNEEVLQVVRRIALREADRVRAANPGITRRMLLDLHEAFIEHFGQDHLICSPQTMATEVTAFHHQWDPPLHEGYVNAGALATEVDLENAGTVGLIADPDWGYVVVEGLDRLFTAIRTGDVERCTRWLRDGSHPAAFRCAWRNHAKQTEQVCSTIVGESIDWNTDSIPFLKRLKPSWFPPHPTVLPLPSEVAAAPPHPGPPPSDGIGLADLLVG